MTVAFAGAVGLLPCKPISDVRLSLSRVPVCAPVPRRRATVSMRSPRKRPRTRVTSRSRGIPDMEFVSRVRDGWESSTPTERAAYAASVVAAGMVASWILNTLIGIFSVLIFGVFALPVMLIAASTGFAIIAAGFAGLIALSTISTVGFGVVGLPLIVTGGIISKLLGPLLIAAPVFMISRFVRSAQRREDVEEESFFDDDEVDDSEDVDFFSEFDRKLQTRAGSSHTKPEAVPSGDLLQWSVQDCVSSLRCAGLIEASRVVAREKIDGQVLAMMDDREVSVELAQGLSIGEKKKLVAWSRYFRS